MKKIKNVCITLLASMFAFANLSPAAFCLGSDKNVKLNSVSVTGSEKSLENNSNLKIIKTKDYDEMCKVIADQIKNQISEKSDSVLGGATGSTYVGVYKQLVNLYNAGKIDFSKVKTLNLDEYAGIAPENPQSYTYYMKNNFFDHINIDPKNTYLPNSLAENSAAECASYDKLFESCGGVDLQLLGIGHNGHIAFNEPGKSFPSKTYCAKLDESTIQANKRFFEKESDVPRFAYTVGIGTIFKAKKIIIAASDPAKAKIIKEAFTGPITPEVPASILQLHNNVTVIGPEDTLALI